MSETHVPLRIDHDPVMDRVTIEGINYSGRLFRDFGHVMPEGSVFRLVKREDGVLHIEQIDNTRIQIGPIKLTCKKCGQVDEFVLDVDNPATARQEKKA